MKISICGLLFFVIFIEDCLSLMLNAPVLDLNIFKCIIKKEYTCPHEDITFFMYSPSIKYGVQINALKPITLKYAGFNPELKTAIIIHGFNGTRTDKHFQYLKDAYINRKYNVIIVDWSYLTRYPCYVTALANMRLVSQCTAQIYAFLTHKGTDNSQITCVGHSLGAHICGMVTNHLNHKPQKIIGLDPARPLIEMNASPSFRLTRDDAHVVQIIHTNAGTLGQQALTGSVDFCINGGKQQPYCKGHPIRRSRCSHFLSVCYLAKSLYTHKKGLAVPCPNGCQHVKTNHLPIWSKDPRTASALVRYTHIGQDTPDSQTGAYCVQLDFAKNCPFGD